MGAYAPSLFDNWFEFAEAFIEDIYETFDFQWLNFTTEEKSEPHEKEEIEQETTMYSKSYTVSGTETYYEPTRYIYDLNTEYSQVLAEYGGTGAPRDTYVYGADGRTSHNETENYIYDGRGSVSEVVADGTVTNTLRYDPFGKILQGEPKQDRIYGYNGTGS